MLTSHLHAMYKKYRPIISLNQHDAAGKVPQNSIESRFCQSEENKKDQFNSFLQFHS